MDNTLEQALEHARKACACGDIEALAYWTTEGLYSEWDLSLTAEGLVVQLEAAPEVRLVVPLEDAEAFFNKRMENNRQHWLRVQAMERAARLGVIRE